MKLVLSEQQKSDNRKLSQSRVVCENAFAGVKRYGVVSQIYRNHKYDFDDKLMLTASGLWNLHLMAAFATEPTASVATHHHRHGHLFSINITDRDGVKNPKGNSSTHS